MQPLITFPLFAAPYAKKAISKQTYNYDIHNGKLKGITYGNGLVEEYVYNDLDMISEIWYTKDGVRTKAYSYFYTSDGKIAELTDHLLGKGEIYTYGTDGKLDTVSKFDSETKKMSYSENLSYDEKGRYSGSAYGYSYTYNGSSYRYELSNVIRYNTDETIDDVNICHGNYSNDINYNYDKYGRLTDTT